MLHGHLAMPRGNLHALDAARRWLNVDVLVSAATGKASTRQVGPGLLVDPGSITGISCTSMSTGQPSFSLLSIDAGKVLRCNGSLCVRPLGFQQSVGSDNGACGAGDNVHLHSYRWKRHFPKARLQPQTARHARSNTFTSRECPLAAHLCHCQQCGSYCSILQCPCHCPNT
jgi:hypothetical protein